MDPTKASSEDALVGSIASGGRAQARTGVREGAGSLFPSGVAWPARCMLLTGPGLEPGEGYMKGVI
jgi:hypothetical protein